MPSSETPDLTIPSGLPEMSGRGDETAALANRVPFRLGSPNTGALGNVEARQEANSLGLPSSAVRNGAIEPPKMHRGFWDRLKSIGEGAITSMGRQAEQNARGGREQSLESLLGAGAAGGVVGGVSPLTIDALRNQAQAERDMGTLQQQQGLEAGQAQIDALRQRAKAEDPAIERERDDIRQVYQGIISSGQKFDPENPEHKQLHDRAAALKLSLPYGAKPAPTRAPRGAQTGKMKENGVTLQTEYDPETNKWVKSQDAEGRPIVLDEKPAEKPDETPQQRAERNAKRESANAEAEKFKVLEGQHQSNIDGLNTNLGQLNQQLANLPRTADGKAQDLVQYEYLKDKIGRTESQIEKATNERNSAAEKKNQAQSDALKYDFGGSQAPQDPKVKEYADKFFNGNYAAADAAIKKQRGQ